MYKVFIAFRYLTSRPISLVSIIGIFLSVGALIVVVSVMSGFLRETKAFIRGTMADIVVTPLGRSQASQGSGDPNGVPAFQKWSEVLKRVPGVAGVSPRFNRGALIRRSDGGDQFIGSTRFSQINFVVALGINVEMEKEVSNFEKFLTDLDNSSLRVEDVNDPFHVPQRMKPVKYLAGDYPSILIGEDKFRQLRLRKGSLVTLATLDEESLEEGGGEVKAFEQRFFIAGAFRSGNHQFDTNHVIIPMEAGQEWVGVEGDVSEIYVALEDYQNKGKEIQAAMKTAMDKAGLDGWVETWEERNAIFLGAVENERTILGVILAFFILIATFNVYATIAMMVTDKTKDIGILVSMGATSYGIMITFVICGLMMWLIGSILGIIGGVLFSLNINEIKDFIERTLGIEVFRKDVYNFREIPVELSPSFIGLIVAGTFVLCFFFSLLPSLRASWMDPVKALRHE